MNPFSGRGAVFEGCSANYLAESDRRDGNLKSQAPNFKEIQNLNLKPTLDMIQLNRNYNLPDRAEEDIPMKVVGVGGAGGIAAPHGGV